MSIPYDLHGLLRRAPGMFPDPSPPFQAEVREGLLQLRTTLGKTILLKLEDRKRFHPHP